MAETAGSSSSPSEAHVVEIPVDSQTQPLTHQQEDDPQSDPEPNPILHHPLTEISGSPGHRLLLKLFQRHEDQLAQRVGLKETRLDNLKREAFYLSSLFFAFHGLFFTLLFASSIAQVDGKACRKWWVPCCLSATTSVVLISAVQAKVWGYWREMRAVAVYRSEGRALTRMMQELRMKGSSFDLSKETPAVAAAAGAKRPKCSSVEVEFRPVRWLKQNLVAFCLIVFAGLVAPACKFVLCS